jgi:hypothetical protein
MRKYHSFRDRVPPETVVQRRPVFFRRVVVVDRRHVLYTVNRGVFRRRQRWV